MKPLLKLLGRGAPLAKRSASREGGFSRARLVAGLLCLVLVLGTPFLLYAPTASAYVGVIPAAGGDEVEVGSSAPLTGPSITETAPGDIGEGDIVLQAPPGFEFDTTRYVTATAANTGNCVPEEPAPEAEEGSSPEQYAPEEELEAFSPPENRPLLLNGAESQTVAPTTDRIAVSVIQTSSGECTAGIEWSGITVKAIEAGSGSITKVSGGNVISGVADGVSDLGWLSAPEPEPEPPASVDSEPEPGETSADDSNGREQYTGEPEETAPDEGSLEKTVAPETEPEETAATDPADPVESTSVIPDETTAQAQPEKTAQEPAVPERSATAADAEEPAAAAQYGEGTTGDPEPEEITVTEQDPEPEEITVIEQDEPDQEADPGLTMTVDSEATVSFGQGLSFAGTGSGDSGVTAFREGATGAYYIKDGRPAQYAAVVTVESSGPWTGSVSATEAGTSGMGVAEESMRWRLGDMSDLPAARAGAPFSTAPDSTVFDTASYCEHGSTRQAGLCTYNFDYSLRVLGSDSLGTFSSVVTYMVSPL